MLSWHLLSRLDDGKGRFVSEKDLQVLNTGQESGLGFGWISVPISTTPCKAYWLDKESSTLSIKAAIVAAIERVTQKTDLGCLYTDMDANYFTWLVTPEKVQSIYEHWHADQGQTLRELYKSSCGHDCFDALMARLCFWQYVLSAPFECQAGEQTLNSLSLYLLKVRTTLRTVSKNGWTANANYNIIAV